MSSCKFETYAILYILIITPKTLQQVQQPGAKWFRVRAGVFNQIYTFLNLRTNL